MYRIDLQVVIFRVGLVRGWLQNLANIESKLSLRAISNRFLVPFHVRSFSASSALFLLSSKQLQSLPDYGVAYTTDMCSVAVQSIGCCESNIIELNRIVFLLGESPITTGNLGVVACQGVVTAAAAAAATITMATRRILPHSHVHPTSIGMHLSFN